MLKETARCLDKVHQAEGEGWLRGALKETTLEREVWLWDFQEYLKKGVTWLQ